MDLGLGLGLARVLTLALTCAQAHARIWLVMRASTSVSAFIWRTDLAWRFVCGLTDEADDAYSCLTDCQAQGQD